MTSTTTEETAAATAATTPTPPSNGNKVVFRNLQHKRQSLYGSGLTADLLNAYTDVMLNDPTVFTDTKNAELETFFSSLQPGDIVGIIGDLLVCPPTYSFNPDNSTIDFLEFDGGTVKKPIAKQTLAVDWKDNFQLGIYYRAGYVEHLYRDAVATDGGQTMEVDETEFKEHLKKQIETAKEIAAAKEAAKAVAQAAATSEPAPV